MNRVMTSLLQSAMACHEFSKGLFKIYELPHLMPWACVVVMPVGPANRTQSLPPGTLDLDGLGQT